jgi:hypothetical protein
MRGAEINDLLIAVAVDGSGANTARAPSATMARESPAQVAAEVALLRELSPAADRAVWVTFTTPAEAGLPGELLRQLREAGQVVHGFADRAALLAAWIDAGPELAVLDISRRHFCVDLAVRKEGFASLRRHVPLAGGEQGLVDAWLRLAASTLVQQTRFDPLHDLQHENALRAQLPALAAAAQQDGQAGCDVDTGASSVRLALTRDQFAAAARMVLAPLARALQALSAAHGDATLLVPATVLQIPGMDAVLAAARFSRLCRIEDGLAASAASLLAPSADTSSAGVPWLSRLPLLSVHAPESVLQPLQFGGSDPLAMATHVVYGGKVMPITASGIVIGRDPGEVSALRLPEGLAGISRRHCTLRRDGGRTQVIDHSSHGTFLDGARVRGRALLPAGGMLRLGDPGIELPLVAIDTH